ncbi:MAG TPA: sigma-54 dependent transcriptional regulator [Gemmataceae bacterium]|nr:sigma-54 dependent transcriptional regulator [Gemmataceae bacterium]
MSVSVNPQLHFTGPVRILVVEDNEIARKHLRQLLQTNCHYEVDSVSDVHKALAALEQNSYSLVLTDLRLPGGSGLDLIRTIQERRLPVTTIVMTGFGSIDDAVQAIRLGAYDFLTKPTDIDNLRLVIERALRERSLQNELATLRAQLQKNYAFHNVLSKNPRMHGIFELINNLGHTTTTVLIEGETGTGKEQVARAIHEASCNRSGPLVAVNCAALPETLLESELFGHEKGAFTNAVSQRKGRFEAADKGTIFLDEVGDVPAAMQAKLLRVLQERCFERVGGTDKIEVDVRVVTATNRPLRRLVKKGTFREDLYYRINVVRIELPPLRERLEDIPLLATHFMQKYAPQGETPKQIDPAAMQVLLNYRWPGNIRELENVIERACVTSREQMIEVNDLPTELVQPAPAKMPSAVSLDKPLPDLLREATATIEQQYLRQALKRAHGNVVRTAKISGLSRRSITAKIAEYGIDRTLYRENGEL